MRVRPFQFAERLDGASLLASIWEWANKLNLRAYEGRKARAGLDLNKRLIVKRPRGRFCAQQRRNTESLKTEVHGLCLGAYGLCLVKLP